MITSYHCVTPATQPGAISISKYPPKDQGYAIYPALAPGKWFRSAKFEDYLTLYAKILSQLDPQVVWDDLHNLADGKEPIILCFESPGTFCHRRLVANWLSINLGVLIQEGRFSKKTGDRIVVEPWEVRKGFAIPAVRSGGGDCLR
jgi:hypothetical protein